MKHLEPLPPDLDELLAAERDAPAPPPAVARRVEARVRATVAIGATVGAAATAGKTAAAGTVGGSAGGAASAVTKPMLIALAAAGAGAGISAGTDALTGEVGVPEPPRVERAAVPEPPAAAPSGHTAPVEALADAGVPPDDAAASPDAHRASAARTAKDAPASGPTRRRLARERSLLDTARTRLRTGAPREALARIDEHRRRFPDGVLAEERDALEVHALVRARRWKTARERGRAFLDRYPDSIHRTAVDRLIQEGRKER